MGDAGLATYACVVSDKEVYGAHIGKLQYNE